MKYKLLIALLLTTGATKMASAQWVGLQGTAQKNTSNGQFRWTFGGYGTFNPYDIFFLKSSFNAKLDSLKAANNTWSGDNIFLNGLHYYSGGVNNWKIDQTGVFSQNSTHNFQVGGGGNFYLDGQDIGSFTIGSGFLNYLNVGGTSGLKLGVDNILRDKDNKAYIKSGDTSISNTYAKKDTVRKYYASYGSTKVLQIDSTAAYEKSGDSFTGGFNSTVASRGYARIIQNNLGLTTLFTNSASGTGFLWNVDRAYKQSPTVNNTRVTTAMIGYTDVGRLGQDPRLFTMARNAYMAFIANKFLKTAVPASDASITYTGTWVNYTLIDSAGTKAGTLAGTVKQTNSSGATVSYTFTGPTLVIGTVATDAADQDDMIVAIDGNASGTYNFSNQVRYSPQLTAGVQVYPYLNYHAQSTVIYFDNLGTGSHTVVITKGSNTAKKMVIDYMGTLNPATVTSPLVIGEVVHQTQAGINFYQATYGSHYTNGTIDSLNRVIRATVNVFSQYTATVAPTNSTYNPVTDVDPADNIHPLDIGHEHIAQGFLQVMLNTSKLSFGVGAYKSTTGKYNVGSQIAGATGTARMYTVTKPGGGLYNPALTTSTGAIRITLPSNAATMMVIKGTIYSHTTGQSTVFKISTYGSTLTNGNSASFTDAPGYQVRYYTNGTTPNIYIGELGTTWGFLKVSIDEVLIGHSGASDVTYGSGWSIGIEPTAFVGTLAATVDARATVPVSGQVALTAGVATVSITGLTTTSNAAIGFVSIGGTVTTTWQYKAVCTAGTLTITAITNTGSTDTTDTSTLSYIAIK